MTMLSESSARLRSSRRSSSTNSAMPCRCSGIGSEGPADGRRGGGGGATLPPTAADELPAPAKGPPRESARAALLLAARSSDIVPPRLRDALRRRRWTSSVILRVCPHDTWRHKDTTYAFVKHTKVDQDQDQMNKKDENQLVNGIRSLRTKSLMLLWVSKSRPSLAYLTKSPRERPDVRTASLFRRRASCCSAC